MGFQDDIELVGKAIDAGGVAVLAMIVIARTFSASLLSSRSPVAGPGRKLVRPALRAEIEQGAGEDHDPWWWCSGVPR